MSDDLISLQRQLAEKQTNLRHINERMAQYVLSTDIPLQLVKEKEELEAAIQALKQRIASASATTVRAPSTRADLLKLLIKRLGSNDLHRVCFGLEISYDELGGPDTPLSQRIIALYERFEREDDLAPLFEAIRLLRDDIPLPDAASLARPAPTTGNPPTTHLSTTPSPTTPPPTSPAAYGSCFISYSSRDEAFARRLYDDLKARGVRAFFAPEDLPIGAKIRDTLHQKIVEYDKLLLILSQHSVNSAWVEDEVERALARERRDNSLVLFPIRLDDTVLTATQAWAETVHDTRNIGDFTRWTDPPAYQRALERLLRDLQLSSPPPPPEIPLGVSSHSSPPLLLGEGAGG